MADIYYSFIISAQNTNATAYYAINFFSEVTIVQGAYQFSPTGTTSTLVSIYPNSVGNQLPACRVISGGVTLVTSADEISGQVSVSPALSVPVTFQLWGINLIGTVTVNPGQTQVPFEFKVSPSQGLQDAAAAQKLLDEQAPRP